MEYTIVSVCLIGLVNSAVSSFHYLALNSKVDWWMMNWKGHGSSHGPFYYCSRICFREIRESISNFSQDSHSLGQNLNPGHPNWKSGVLNTWPRHLYTEETKVIVADWWFVMFTVVQWLDVTPYCYVTATASCWNHQLKFCRYYPNMSLIW
jgi:hypothetical protein